MIGKGLTIGLFLFLSGCVPVQSQVVDSVVDEPKTLLFNLTYFEPSALHLNTYKAMTLCLEQYERNKHPDPGFLKWAVSNTIVFSPSGLLASGLYAKDGPFIVLQNQEKWHMDVVSHESIHAIADAFHPQDDYLFDLCELK